VSVAVRECVMTDDDAPVDVATIAAIYREHHAFVWNSARRLGVPDALVDDVVQDVFVVVARRLGEFERRASIKTWLFAIAMRVVRAHRRAIGRHERRIAALAHDGGRTETSAARSDAAATLHRLLAALDPAKATAFILAELEGLSAPEIAAELGVNVNTIYARIRAARRELERAVAKEGER
jgi:RNA polymerase sigma-70 factor, ECF subfamily